MKILIKEKLSQHKSLTPEGYLICTDAILARTGKQEYRKSELWQDASDDIIEVDRKPDEVFDTATIASFENKPITIEHPDEDVDSTNWKDYQVGFVRDVRRSIDNGQDVLIGNLIIQDKDAIDLIQSGEMTELSCGYNCDIKDEDEPQQRNIRGNHVALCKQGRAGNARIIDSYNSYKEAENAMKERHKLDKKFIDKNGNYSIARYSDITKTWITNDDTEFTSLAALTQYMKRNGFTLKDSFTKDTSKIDKLLDYIVGNNIDLVIDVYNNRYKINNRNDYYDIKAYAKKIGYTGKFDDGSMSFQYVEDSKMNDTFERIMKIKKSDIDIDYFKKALKSNDYNDVRFVKEDAQYIYVYGDPNDVNYLEFESSINDSNVKDAWSGTRNGIVYTYHNGKYYITHRNGKTEILSEEAFNDIKELYKYVDSIEDSKVNDDNISQVSNIVAKLAKYGNSTAEIITAIKQHYLYLSINELQAAINEGMQKAGVKNFSISKSELMKDSINSTEDMAVWQLKPETNLDKLSIAITNKDISSLNAMLNIVNKDIDDYNNNIYRLSTSDKLMLKKRFKPLVDKINQLGIKTHTLKINDSVKDDNVESVMKAIKAVNLHKDSKIKDSDVLYKMAYELGQLANYFDRANASKSRELLAKDDDTKIAQFYTLGLKTLAQLKKENEQMSKHKDATYSFSTNNIVALILDAANKMYYMYSCTRSDATAKKFEVLSTKLIEQAKLYNKLAIKDSKVNDKISLKPGDWFCSGNTYYSFRYAKVYQVVSSKIEKYNGFTGGITVRIYSITWNDNYNKPNLLFKLNKEGLTTLSKDELNSMKAVVVFGSAEEALKYLKRHLDIENKYKY